MASEFPEELPKKSNEIGRGVEIETTMK